MEWTQILILSIIQGVTEFLPISSSAHLIFIPQILNWPDQGLAMDVAVHFGTLGAVLAYFRHDILQILQGLRALLRGQTTPGGRLFFHLSLATLPVVFSGFVLVQSGTTHLFRQAALIGWMSILFGILLGIADRLGKTKKNISRLRYRDALLVGCAQVIALIPGVSRSGICVTAMRALGFNRTASAEFSCLLSIPTVIAATTLMGIKIYQYPQPFQIQENLVAALVSFLIGWASIALMMQWVKHASFNIFILYRVILGIVLLYWSYV